MSKDEASKDKAEGETTGTARAPTTRVVAPGKMPLATQRPPSSRAAQPGSSPSQPASSPTSDASGASWLWTWNPLMLAAHGFASAPASGTAAEQGDAHDGQNEVWSHLIGEVSEPMGTMARVDAPKGLRLRKTPAPDGETIAIMPFDTLVHAERRTTHGWCYVVALGDARGGGGGERHGLRRGISSCPRSAGARRAPAPDDVSRERRPEIRSGVKEDPEPLMRAGLLSPRQQQLATGLDNVDGPGKG